ncbi:RNA-guided endonuclease TnpB family protein [Streptomyces sp. KM77-8]|uniref:RNA-guided endonuclease TnpB family protein n=1 Tax=Streptomyces haneummycinicus TaxID=3074435 RepID=A0AAT9HYD3_9ACTN
MVTWEAGEETGRARYTYRLRVSSAALAGLGAEWARCRWIWNECVAMSRKVHGLNRDATGKVTCGPAQLDKLLTGARAVMGWLREGSSVPQQQIIRDFGRSRAKALKDIQAGLPMRQRAGMPRVKRKRDALPSMNYTRRGFRLKDGRLHLAGGVTLTVVWSRGLPADPTSVRVYRDSLGHWYASFVVETALEPLPATGAVIGIDWGVRKPRPPPRTRTIFPTPSTAAPQPRSWPGTRSRWRGGSPCVGRPRRRATGPRPRGGQGPQEGRQAAAGRRPQVGEDGRARLRPARRRGLQAEVPREVDDGPQGRRRGDRRDQDRVDRDGPQARPHRAPRAPGPHHDGLRTVRCENQARTPLSERTYACTACGAVSPRDKNSARVMLVRAGLNPAGADGGSPPGAPLPEAA